MLSIFVRIKTVDPDPRVHKMHAPTLDMTGRFVRITNLETVPEDEDPAHHIWYGILIDANRDDVEGGEVELLDHEIESNDNMPTLFAEELA